MVLKAEACCSKQAYHTCLYVKKKLESVHYSADMSILSWWECNLLHNMYMVVFLVLQD